MRNTHPLTSSYHARRSPPPAAPRRCGRERRGTPAAGPAGQLGEPGAPALDLDLTQGTAQGATRQLSARLAPITVEASPGLTALLALLTSALGRHQAAWKSEPEGPEPEPAPLHGRVSFGQVSLRLTAGPADPALALEVVLEQAAVVLDQADAADGRPWMHREPAALLTQADATLLGACISVHHTGASPLSASRCHASPCSQPPCSACNRQPGAAPLPPARMFWLQVSRNVRPQASSERT